MAALLPAGWNMRLLDLNVTRLTAKGLAWADAVFVSAMLVQKESARQVITRCRQAGVRVIAGGPLFTSESEQFEEVDHFVLNEGEMALPPFLADWVQGEAKRVYRSPRSRIFRNRPSPYGTWSICDAMPP